MAHDYDLKHLIGTILASRAYQMAAVPRTAEAPVRGYQFRGPEIRRLSAEQFSDAIGSITGEWSTYNPPAGRGGGNRPAAGANAHAGRPSAPRSASSAPPILLVLRPPPPRPGAGRPAGRAGRAGQHRAAAAHRL